jgi:hypothetical protein
MSRLKPEIYISVDRETSGSIPGEYNDAIEQAEIFKLMLRAYLTSRILLQGHHFRLQTVHLS